jgi:hypothetical protein
MFSIRRRSLEGAAADHERFRTALCGPDYYAMSATAASGSRGDYGAAPAELA